MGTGVILIDRASCVGHFGTQGHAMKVLLMDDEPSALGAISAYLTTCGHHVVGAEDGEAGWNRFLDGPESFQCIVSDLKMPVLGGLGFLKRLREAGHTTPVILISGHAPHLEDLLECGLNFSGVLEKPFAMDRLDEMLGRLSVASAG